MSVGVTYSIYDTMLLTYIGNVVEGHATVAKHEPDCCELQHTCECTLNMRIFVVTKLKCTVIRMMTYTQDGVVKERKPSILQCAYPQMHE